MAAVTGAIWKCATDSYENVERFEELELMKTLVGILKVILQYFAIDFILIGANKTKPSCALVMIIIICF